PPTAPLDGLPVLLPALPPEPVLPPPGFVPGAVPPPGLEPAPLPPAALPLLLPPPQLLLLPLPPGPALWPVPLWDRGAMGAPANAVAASAVRLRTVSPK